MEILPIALLFLLGLGAGIYGTIIGAGGGFVIVPILLIVPFYAQLSARDVTGISLIAVLCNALVATQAYLRQGRVDVRVALTFALFAVPGSVAGRTLVGQLMDRAPFEVAFGALLILLGVYLLFRKPPKPNPDSGLQTTWWRLRRSHVMPDGSEATMLVDLRLGALLSFLVGFLAAVFGVGGGIMFVPMLVGLLAYPPHIATATSQLFLLMTALVSVTTDLVSNTGIIVSYWTIALALGVGVVVGAQSGALLSRRIGGGMIVRLLAVALAIAGLRLVMGAIGR